MTKLYNINSLPSDYAQIAALYDEHQAKGYEKISVELHQWFKANMAAPLGAVLDLLADNLTILRTLLVVFSRTKSPKFATQIDLFAT